MQSKYLYLLAALLFVGLGALYFYLHPSYRLSLEAKIYYSIADYDSAYEVASKAYDMNRYNRMAFTIMVQSQTAKKYIDFINLAREYYKQIEAISKQNEVSDADRIKIKLLAEVVLESYKRLNPTRLTDKKLTNDAKNYNESFLKLYEKLFTQKSQLKDTKLNSNGT